MDIHHTLHSSMSLSSYGSTNTGNSSSLTNTQNSSVQQQQPKPASHMNNSTPSTKTKSDHTLIGKKLQNLRTNSSRETTNTKPKTSDVSVFLQTHNLFKSFHGNDLKILDDFLTLNTSANYVAHTTNENTLQTNTHYERSIFIEKYIIEKMMYKTNLSSIIHIEKKRRELILSNDKAKLDNTGYLKGSLCYDIITRVILLLKGKVKDQFELEDGLTTSYGACSDALTSDYQSISNNFDFEVSNIARSVFAYYRFINDATIIPGTDNASEYSGIVRGDTISRHNDYLKLGKLLELETFIRPNLSSRVISRSKQLYYPHYLHATHKNNHSLNAIVKTYVLNNNSQQSPSKKDDDFYKSEIFLPSTNANVGSYGPTDFIANLKSRVNDIVNKNYKNLIVFVAFHENKTVIFNPQKDYFTNEFTFSNVYYRSTRDPRILSDMKLIDNDVVIEYKNATDAQKIIFDEYIVDNLLLSSNLFNQLKEEEKNNNNIKMRLMNQLNVNSHLVYPLFDTAKKNGCLYSDYLSTDALNQRSIKLNLNKIIKDGEMNMPYLFDHELEHIAKSCDIKHIIIPDKKSTSSFDIFDDDVFGDIISSTTTNPNNITNNNTTIMNDEDNLLTEARMNMKSSTKLILLEHVFNKHKDKSVTKNVIAVAAYKSMVSYLLDLPGVKTPQNIAKITLQDALFDEDASFNLAVAAQNLTNVICRDGLSNLILNDIISKVDSAENITAQVIADSNISKYATAVGRIFSDLFESMNSLKNNVILIKSDFKTAAKAVARLMFMHGRNLDAANKSGDNDLALGIRDKISKLVKLKDELNQQFIPGFADRVNNNLRKMVRDEKRASAPSYFKHTRLTRSRFASAKDQKRTGMNFLNAVNTTTIHITTPTETNLFDMGGDIYINNDSIDATIAFQMRLFDDEDGDNRDKGGKTQ